MLFRSKTSQKAIVIMAMVALPLGQDTEPAPPVRLGKLLRGTMTLNLHPSQSLNREIGRVSVKDWEYTMDPDEAKWCLEEIRRKAYSKTSDGELIHDCADSFRAARKWKSSQRRRFVKLRSCCGSCEWEAKRWNWRKFRWDIYLLGFNYGH